VKNERRSRLSIRVLIALIAAVCGLHGAGALAAPSAVIDAHRTLTPINPNVYGLFIEHASGLVYTGLWSEMVYDRKFYYSIPNTATISGGYFAEAPRTWSPVGIDSISMDTQQPYAGKQTPAIALDPSVPRGITQALPALLAGKRYVGHVVLAGTPGTKVSVTMTWGSGATDRQTVSIRKLAPGFAKYPIAFKCPVDSTTGAIELTATGSGALRVGAVSLMPADNIEGWRREVIEVLSTLHSGMYRWPGGNFVSGHDWRNAIGDPDRRPPIYDSVWSAVQSNDVGTDEFMTLCRLTGVEPYITVNSGTGDAASAADYVEYANGPAHSRMGKLRAANGHPRPYHVKYWNIGNEMWGSWQVGYMPMADYMAKHNEFAREMRKVDRDIILIGSAAMPDTMTGSKESLLLGDKLIPDYLGPADWTGAMFLQCLDNLDMISEHFYNYDTHFDLAQAKQVANDPNEPLVDWMRRPANHIRIKYEEYQEYLKRIPALQRKPVPISLDEYAYIAGSGYKNVPAYAWTLNEMFRHSDIYQAGALTFITTMFNASGGKAVLNPLGMLYKLYSDHYGKVPVEVSGDSPQPKPTDPPGGEQPVVNAGSDTYPLDVAAAWTEDRRALTIAVVNPTDTAQELEMEVRGVRFQGKGTLRRMAPESLTANVQVGKDPGVTIDTSVVEKFPATTTFPPWSVSLYELPVNGSHGPGPGPGPHHGPGPGPR
jgi:alpha-N-arabinofuranosidase